MSFITKTIQNESEFQSVDAIYQDCFGTASVPTETQWQWWQKFPNGIIVLYEDEKIIGGLSYWPLNAIGFELFSNGKIKESDIQTQHIDYLNPKGVYISEIAIIQAYRNKNLASMLMKTFFEKTIKYLEIPVLALAYSDRGRKILKQFDFKILKKAKEIPDNQDLYFFIKK